MHEMSCFELSLLCLEEDAIPILPDKHSLKKSYPLDEGTVLGIQPTGDRIKGCKLFSIQTQNNITHYVLKKDGNLYRFTGNI